MTMQLKFAMLWSTAALAFSTALASAVPAQAQTYQGLPVNLFRTQATKGSMTINLKARPQKNLALKLTVMDMDIPDEGNLFVNGKRVRALFGKAAVQQNNRKTAQVTVITPRNLWKTGRNKVEFVRAKTEGFNVTKISTWESSAAPTLRPVSNTARRTTSPAPSPKIVSNNQKVTSNNQAVVSNKQGVISWQEVVNQSTKPHVVTPIPAIPSSYCGSHYGSPVVAGINRKAGTTKCNRDKINDSNALRGFTEFNIWNHVARVYNGKYAKPNGQRVEMGNTRLAVLTKGGKWISREFKATCQGRLYSPVVNGIDGGKNGGNPVAQPCNDTAILGYGMGKWTNPKHQYHGWTGQRLNVKGEDIEAVAGWFPAKLINSNLSDNNQYLLNIGMDKKGGKAAGKTARFSGAFSSRYVKLPKNGKSAAIFGSTLSGARWKELCQKGNLPAGFPFEKGCNVPSR